MGTKVRILVAGLIAGVMYKPDQVVELPHALAKAHAADGMVDPNKEAVAYCVNELGAAVIVHQTPPTPEQVQLQAEIATLEASLAAAADEDKAAIQEQIDAAVSAQQ